MSDERLPKEERELVSIEAGQRMAVFMEDPLVQRWFEKEREALMTDMMSDALNSERIQAFVMAINTLDALHAAMKNAVSISSRLMADMDAREVKRNV